MPTARCRERTHIQPLKRSHSLPHQHVDPKKGDNATHRCRERTQYPTSTDIRKRANALTSSPALTSEKGRYAVRQLRERTLIPTSTYIRKRAIAYGTLCERTYIIAASSQIFSLPFREKLILILLNKTRLHLLAVLQLGDCKFLILAYIFLHLLSG